MAVQIKHTFVSAIADDPVAAAAGEVLTQSHWNATHTITGGTLMADAGANLTFYVATTGSDSNPGTLAQPFLTIQHALNVAATFNYQGLYFPTINVADGTYTITQVITFPQLTNVISQTSFVNGTFGFLVGNVTTPANVVVHNTTSGASVMAFSNNLCQWRIKGFTTDAGPGFGIHLQITESAVVWVDDWVFADSAASGNAEPVSMAGFASLFSTGNSTGDTAGISFSAASYGFFARLTGLCFFQFDNAIIIFPNPCHFGNFFFAQGVVFIQLSRISYTNFATVTGSRCTIFNNVTLYTDNGAITDLPGNSTTFVDSSVIYEGFNSGFTSQAALSNAGPPPSANLPSPESTVFYSDTNNQIIWLASQTKSNKFGLKQIGRNVNVQTGAAYTIAYLDQDGRVEMNNAGANTLTVPQDSSFSPNAPSVGCEVRVVQTGAGATTIAAGAGATVNNAGVVGGQWKSVVLYKTAANTWNQVNV